MYIVQIQQVFINTRLGQEQTIIKLQMSLHINRTVDINNSINTAHNEDF
jgi:hypothetical protein